MVDDDEKQVSSDDDGAPHPHGPAHVRGSGHAYLPSSRHEGHQGSREPDAPRAGRLGTMKGRYS
jgi:hypothetical protein